MDRNGVCQRTVPVQSKKLKGAARALLAKKQVQVSDIELAAFKLTRADFKDEESTFDVYPDNWDAVTAFNSLRTQWRMSFVGPIGLDYAVIETVFRFLHIPKRRWGSVFEDLRVLESEALRIFEYHRQNDH